MKVGDLVRHIEYEYLGIITDKGQGMFFVRWGGYNTCNWYSECEMEMISESR